MASHFPTIQPRSTRNGWCISRGKVIQYSLPRGKWTSISSIDSSSDRIDEVLSILVRKDDVAQEHVYLSIPQPCRVIVEKVRAEVRLHVDSTEGSSTIIRFRQVATPDYEFGSHKRNT